ncbi:MAG: hypothetical protein WAK31_18855 [Chthoniobacterales bacterium]
MGSQDITHNSSFYVSLGLQAAAILVLLGLAIVGIVIAVRAKTGTGKGCGVVMAIAFALQSCLVVLWFLISLAAGLESSSSKAGQMQTVQAKDGSCEISVPKSWVDCGDLSKEAVLGSKDPTGNEYVLVFVHSKQDYAGGLDDFAKDYTDSLRQKIQTPQVEPPTSMSINGRSAVRQLVRGEVDRLRIVYRITYFEGRDNFYRIFCWSLDSKAASVAADFDKIAESLHEKVATKGEDHI